MSMLYAGDRPIAGHIGIRSESVLSEGRVERPSSVAVARRVQRTPPRLPREVMVRRHPALRRSAHRAAERLECLRERARVRDG